MQVLETFRTFINSGWPESPEHLVPCRGTLTSQGGRGGNRGPSTLDQKQGEAAARSPEKRTEHHINLQLAASCAPLPRGRKRASTGTTQARERVPGPTRVGFDFPADSLVHLPLLATPVQDTKGRHHSSRKSPSRR